MYDFKYEHFDSIYEFSKALERPINACFIRNEASHSNDEEFTKTKSYAEADDFLKNGWDCGVREIERDIASNFSKAVQVMRNKSMKSVAGYAPCVPDAIRGIPKSMLSSRPAKVRKNRSSVHIIFNNTAPVKVESDELMSSGLTVMKLAISLDRASIRTRIDVVPKMSVKNQSCYGCTVTIKDYRQPFNVSKIAYPLAHPSFFRRHGFRYLETMDGLTCSEFVYGYGRSMIMCKDEAIHDEYLKFAKLIEHENSVYIDLLDVREANFDYINLAKNKGIAFA